MEFKELVVRNAREHLSLVTYSFTMFSKMYTTESLQSALIAFLLALFLFCF